MIGFVNIYKPSGITSSKVVVKLRKTFNLSKVGHMGTLDPMASGVLPIAIGKATRMFDYFMDKYKSYRATFEFGYMTDTLDAEGITLATTNNIPSKDDIMNAISSFIGKNLQTPPDYSAKQINGVRAYKLAREGKPFELKAKEVEITKFDLVAKCNNAYTFDITCSSGTYIRAIGRDLAKSLNSYCTMTALERTESGMFNISNTIQLDDLLNSENLSKYIIPITEVFPKIEKIVLSDKDFAKLRNGIALANTYFITNIAFAMYKDELVGVVEVDNNLIRLRTYLME